MHRKVAAALLAALALGIAGCGGSEETLTRAQLARRINVACRQGHAAQEKQMRTSRGSSEDGSRQFVTAIIAGQKIVIARIDDLHPSDALQDQFDAFKKGLQDRVDLFERIVSAGGDEAIQRAVAAADAEGQGINQRLRAVAGRLGVEACV